MPAALSPSLAAGCFSLLVFFYLRQIHTLSLCQWPCRLRWVPVGVASWVVFVDSYTLWALCHFFLDLFVFMLGSFLNLASFRNHLEITLGSVRGHFVIIVCTWHSPGIILEFLWDHLLSFWDHVGFGVISWSSGGHFGIILGSF